MGTAQRNARRVHVRASRSDVWAACTSTTSFRRWWRPLVRFDDGGRSLAPGARWAATVRGPLLYAVAFVLTIEAVEVGSAVAATVEGDIDGSARLGLAPAGDGTDVDLEWTLRPRRPLLRVLHGAVPPLTRWAHDRVVDVCLDRFAAAVEQRASDPVEPPPTPA